MYDNLPFQTTDINTINSFLNSGLLALKNETINYCLNTGAELRTTYSKYYNLTISVKYDINNKPIELKSKGSLHYLMNKGKHNADEKTFKEICQFLLEFAYKFKIDLNTLEIKPPEFAVNILVPFDVNKIIQHTYYEQRKEFIINTPGKPSKISGKTSNDYRLKIYNKFAEFPEYCKPNTLRLEYQTKKMRAIKSTNMKTLADLLNLKNWVKVKDVHLSHFQHLLIYDYTILVSRNSKFKKNASEFSNKINWENLILDIEKGKDYNTKYNDKLRDLRKLSKTHGSDILEKLILIAENQWINKLGICKNYSYFKVSKQKVAPLYKTKDAPFIECNPCTYMKIKRFSTDQTNEFSYI